MIKKMIQLASVKSSSGGAPSSLAWNPQVLGTSVALGVWVPYDDATTVTETSGDITQIDDLSGNDYHFTVEGNSPNWNSATNEVEFVQESSEGLVASMLGDTNTYDMNFFAVFDPITNDNNDQWFTRNNTSRSNASDSAIAWTTGVGGIRVWNGGSAKMNVTSPDGMILYHVKTSQTSGAFIRVNGAQVDSSVDNFGNILDVLRVACDGNGDYSTMNLRGVVITKDGLSVDDYERCEAWLAEKCGVMSDLDAGHTYKNYTFTEPSAFSFADIGSASGGSGSDSQLTSNGDAFGGGDTSDSLSFYSSPVSGDFTLTVQIDSESVAPGTGGVVSFRRLGLMFRESLDADSAYTAIIWRNNGPKWQFLERLTTAASSAEGGTTNTTALPKWIRLSRTGSTFTWEAGDTEGGLSSVVTGTYSSSSDGFVGVVAHSTDNSEVITVNYSNLSLT